MSNGNSFMNKWKKKDLRSVVLPGSIAQAVWSLVYTVSAFKELSIDNSQRDKKLATLATVLGSLYAGATAIFLFGFFAAITRRLALIRIFFPLSATAAAITIACSFLRTIIHFMLKNSLINECIAISTGQNVHSTWGIWNTDPGHNLNPTDANNHCKHNWNHDSFSEILALIVNTVFLPLFAFGAYGYARQQTMAARGRRTSIPATYTPAYTAGAESSIDLHGASYDQPPYAPPEALPPFDKSLPGYSSGELGKKDNDSMRTAVEDDPFTDYDVHGRLK